MIIIYILAAIGGICVLGAVGMVIMFALSETNEKDVQNEEIICAITDERCMYTIQRETCYGCPIAEEAEEKFYNGHKAMMDRTDKL